MTKRYDEPIEVTSRSGQGAPLSFAWRGRRYDVDAELSAWREAGEWWDGTKTRDRQYHRIVARPSGLFATGDVDQDGFMRHAGAVYDVYRDRGHGGWRLARVWD